MKTNSTVRRIASTLLMAFCLVFLPTAIEAQTSAFTYQGKLSDGVNAASGTYDLQFTLFDAGGTPIGAVQTKEDVSVANGVFSTTLDFGAAAFDGTERTLQISVRRGTETGAFTALAPRQAINSAPYAIRALNATNLGGVAATDYLQANGSGANLTNLNAANLTGTVADAQLSSNVALRNSANTLTGDQTISGSLAQTGAVADLNLTNGLLVRGEFGTGAIPATGAGSRMMWYPGKAAFRAGRLFNDEFNGFNGATYWDDANIGTGSVAFTNSLASGERSFAFSGSASGPGAIAMGLRAEATGEESLALGLSARANGQYSVAIGPSRARGFFAIAIGYQNIAIGDFSVAIGKSARTCATTNCFQADAKRGAIVISDACNSFQDDAVYASADNQVNIRGCGGFRFFTSMNTLTQYGLISGVQLAPGGGAWLSMSDRNAKENFLAVDKRDILQRVLKLPISTWNYKTQATSIRHIGAMAQDFKAAFAVGEDDKMISTIDPDGVAFAAIQGLNEELNDRTTKLQTENNRLKKQLAAQNKTNAEQNKIIAEFEARLKRLEQAAVKPRRTVRRNK